MPASGPAAYIYLPDDERISIENRKSSAVIVAIHNRVAQIPPIEIFQRTGRGECDFCRWRDHNSMRVARRSNF